MRDLNDDSYRRFCGPPNIEKALNTLWGVVSGVTADKALTDNEIEAIERWISLYAQVADRHPYSEVIPVLTAALEDRVLFEEEKADILWLCERLREDSPYYRPGHERSATPARNDGWDYLRPQSEQGRA